MFKWLKALFAAPTLEEVAQRERDREDSEMVNKAYRKLRSAPKETKRVLVLDELVHRTGFFPPSRLPNDIRLTPIYEGDLVENLDRIHYNADLERRIRLLITIVGPDAFDAFIIGNNVGNGVWKTELLAELIGDEALHAKTVVVWNDSFPQKDGSTEYRGADAYRRFEDEDDKYVVNSELFTDRAHLDATTWELLGLEPLTT